MFQRTHRDGSTLIKARHARTRSRRARSLASWERLESRELLATIVWKSTVTAGAWGNAANWVGGVVPGSGDTAQVNNAGITVSIADGQTYSVGDIQFAVAGSTLSLSSGTLNVTSTSTASNLKNYTQTGGTLDGAATVKIGGAASWTGGSMSGTGSTVTDGGLTIGGNAASTPYAVTLDARTLVNNSAASMLQATGPSGYNTSLYLGSAATFRNSSTGSFDFHGDFTTVEPTGNPYGGSFVNEGSLTKSTGSTSSTYTSYFNSSVAFSNSGAGSVDVAVGTLTFRGGGSFSSSSPVHIADDAILDFAAGSFDLSEDISGTAAATLRLSGATINVLGDSAVSPTTTFTSGIVTGPATLTFSGPLAWSGGTMSGTGQTVTDGGLTIGGNAASTPYAVTLDARTLVNNSAASMLQATGPSGYNTSLYLGSAATFRNSSTGSFDFHGDFTTIEPTGNPYGGSFVNEGSLTKSTGSASSSYPSYFNSSVAFSNSGAGSVDVAVGTLTFRGGGSFSSSSPVHVADDAILDFAAGSYDITGAISCGAGATVRFSGGTIDMTGNYNVAGTTSITGGTFNYSGPDTTFGSLAMSGGTLNGSATVHIAGTAVWSGGTMSGTGQTVTDGGLTIGGNAASTPYVVTLDARTLVNNSAASMLQATGPSGYNTSLYLGSAATFRNSSTGSFDFHGDFTTIEPTGNPYGGSFVNEGSLTKSTGSTSSTYTSYFNSSVAFSNSGAGSVDVAVGTLTFRGGGSFSSSSPVHIADDAILDFAAGSYDITGAISCGAGATVRFSGGTIDMTGNYNVAGTTSITGGTFNYSGPDTTFGSLAMSGGTLNGSATVHIAGTAVWSGGTMSGTGQTVTDGGLTIGGNAASTPYVVTLDARTLVNNSAASMLQATGPSGYNTSLYLGSAATFRNSSTGSFDFHGDFTTVEPTGNPYGGSFVNEGSLTKSTGSTSSTYTSYFNSSVAFSNSGAGSVDVAVGTLTFRGGGSFSSSSPVHIADDAILDFAAGSFDLSEDISGTAAATLRLSGATINVLGDSAVSPTTTFTSGIVTGPATLTFSGPLAWSGGTMSGTGSTVTDGGLTIGGNAASTPYVVTLDARTLVNNSAASMLQATGPSGYNTSLYLGSAATLRNSSTGSFDFHGDFTTVEPTGNPYGGSFVNEGSLTKSTGSSSSYPSYFSSNIAFSNSGVVDVQTGTLSIRGTLTNLSGTTLNGGSYLVKGTLQLPGSSTTITTLGAAMILDGTSAQVLNQSDQDALAPLTTITAGGGFTLLNGKTFTTVNSAFSNAGALKVGTGSTFTSTGSYTQSGGSTDVAGGTLVSTASPVTINGGVLAGSGTGKVQGNVLNAGGHVQPGGAGAAGSFTIQGNYTQQAGGSFDAEIGGTAVGSGYDQLVVTGTASLNGAMNASPIGGFLPAQGDDFRVISAGTRSGTFATLNGLYLGFGRKLMPVYNPADFTLSTVLSSVTIALSPSIPNPTYGDSLSFTAIISPATSGSPTPTGTVQFLIDGIAFGSPVTLTASGGNGVATSSITAQLGAVSHTITADYSGEFYFVPNSASINVSVARAHLTITPDNKTRGIGQANPALTATLSGFVNGETLATSGVTGTPSLATTAVTASAAGNYPITVSGIGSLAAANYDFLAALFGQGTLTVTQGTVTGVVVSSSLSPSTYGDAVNFTVNVNGVSGGPIPTGSVQFLVDGTNFGSTVALANGSATSGSTSALGAGGHTITANYSGDVSYATASGSFTQNVAKAHLTVTPDNKSRAVGQANPTLTATLSGFVNSETLATSGVTGNPSLSTTAVIASAAGNYPITVSGLGSLAAANYDFPAALFGQGTLTVTQGTVTGVAVVSTLSPSTYGDAIHFTVNVTGGGPTPAGSVQFLVDGVNFGSPVALVNGSAVSPSTSSLGAGGHIITANYSGDVSYASSNGTSSQNVNKAHLTITPDNKSRSVGQANPTLTATLSGFVNGESLATSGVTGVPSLSTTATAASPAGTYPITVSGIGTLTATNYDFPAALFGQGTLTVSSAATAVVSVGSSLSPSTYGDAVSFTVLVTGGGPTPTGTVQFLVDGANLGSPVALVNGAATSISTATMGAGNYAISATYSGDSNYPTAGGSFSQAVNKAHLTITPDGKSRTVGQTNPALTATLSGFVNGETLATSGVTGIPALTTTATISSPIGSYPITVVDIGTLAAANYDFPAALFGQGTLTVTQGTVTGVAVVSTLSPSTYGDAIHFTVNVTGGGPTPTGSVQFLVNGVNFGSPVTLVNGIAASPSTSSLGAGNHTITAGYSGDANYAFGGGLFSQAVNRAGLTVIADDASMDHYDALPTFSYHLTGFVHGENAGSAGVVADVAFSTAATSSSLAGYYAITPVVSSLTAANYELGGVQDGTLTVRPKVMDVRVRYGPSASQSMSVLGLTRNLPFLNIGALDVIFSDDVDVDATMLDLTGVNVPGVGFSGFSYSSGDMTATWRLASPLAADRLALLVDGPAAPPAVGTGPNIAARPFRSGFSVLPGDADGDGRVTISDAVVIRNHFSSLGGAYYAWADLNGDGVIDILDVNESRKRIGRTLPPI